MFLFVKRRGEWCRLASLATSADGTAVVTTSIRGFLPINFSTHVAHSGSRPESPSGTQASRADAPRVTNRVVRARGEGLRMSHINVRDRSEASVARTRGAERLMACCRELDQERWGAARMQQGTTQAVRGDRLRGRSRQPLHAAHHAYSTCRAAQSPCMTWTMDGWLALRRRRPQSGAIICANCARPTHNVLRLVNLRAV